MPSPTAETELEARRARTQAAALRRLLQAANADAELRQALAAIDLQRFGQPLDGVTLSVDELRDQLREEETTAALLERDVEILTRWREAGRALQTVLRCACGCGTWEHARALTDDARIPCRATSCPCQDFTVEPTA